MAAYVDGLVEWPKTPNWPHGKACHLVADTVEELHAVADAIGLMRLWFQNIPQHSAPHYDLTEGKRHMALRAGALDATDEEYRGMYLDCLKWWQMRRRKLLKEKQRGN